LQSDPYVIVVPANAPKLLGAINETLAALEADGTLAQIRARWLMGSGGLPQYT
jgi:ABC-type amino acid transport substrate-binding protein